MASYWDGIDIGNIAYHNEIMQCSFKECPISIFGQLPVILVILTIIHYRLLKQFLLGSQAPRTSMLVSLKGSSSYNYLIISKCKQEQHPGLAPNKVS